MTILARSEKGREFFYIPSSAHAVAKKNAAAIRDILNVNNYQLLYGETWHVHDVDEYDTAYWHAQYQRFTLRDGVVHDRSRSVR